MAGSTVLHINSTYSSITQVEPVCGQVVSTANMYRWSRKAQSPNLPRPVSPLFTSVEKHVKFVGLKTKKRKREYNHLTPQHFFVLCIFVW